jgi:hypothetical protein
MPTNEKTNFNIADFVDKEIPTEIIEQLRIAGRVQQVLNPTTVSAVSTSAQQDTTSDPSESPEKELDGFIKNTADLEDTIEQLEELIDEHLKDMSIPPANDSISAAAKRLGSDDGNITKQVLDTAMATIDYWPLMSMGQDPVLAALVGDGTIDGKWFECNQITSAIAKTLTNPPRNEYEAEAAIADSSTKIADNHEKRMIEMILEILLQLWWNMLWPKFIVDMTIINPIRMAIANPTDALITFFQKRPRFKRKKSDWIKKNGPINKLLNKLRKLLLCKIPPPLYPRYDPIVEIDCGGIDDTCPPETEGSEFKPSKENSQIGEFVDSAMDSNCFTSKQLLEGVDKTLPTGFGASPACVKAARTVLDAVLSDALTPPQGEYKPGGAGTTRNSILNVIK